VLGALGMLAVGASLAHTSGIGGPLLAVLLAWPTTSFLAAPYNSLSAQQAVLPPALEARRRTEYLRYGGRQLTYATGGLALVAAVTAAVVALFAPSHIKVLEPQILGPARGQPAHYGDPSSTTRSGGKPGSRPSGSSTSGSSTTTTAGSTTTGTTTGTTTTTTTTTTTGTTTAPTTTAPTTTTLPGTGTTNTTTPPPVTTTGP